MEFKGGVDEAAKMLAGLGPERAKVLLEEIKLKNPEMAAALEKSMVVMSDLQYLTTTMMIELLRLVNIDDFALALRGVDKAVIQHVLSTVSKNMKRDIEDVLSGAPRRLSEVEEAQEKILAVVRDMVDKGQIIIDKDGSETMV